MKPDQRRARLQEARLYLCVGVREDLAAFLDAVLGAGVDIVQLRDKNADAATQVRAAQTFRAAADRHGALFIFNDRADLALATDADGVHVGQDDLPPSMVRALVGEQMLIGRSTHSRAEIETSNREPVDYIGVGPVNATPTKPGRAGTGLELVRDAGAVATRPWFVTGGMDATTLPATMHAGCTRAVVVRAITEAIDPGHATRLVASVLSGLPSAR